MDFSGWTGLYIKTRWIVIPICVYPCPPWFVFLFSSFFVCFAYFGDSPLLFSFSPFLLFLLCIAGAEELFGGRGFHVQAGAQQLIGGGSVVGRAQQDGGGLFLAQPRL